VIDQLHILSKFRIREDQYIRPDDVVSRSDARLHKARITNSNITVRTSVSLGPDARATNMEIANSTSTVRALAILGPDARIADMEIAC
jgi:hypothetical protein